MGWRSMNLTVDVYEAEEKTVIKVVGEIDAYTSPKLNESIYPLSNEAGKNLLIDLTDVTYMDSTGLGVLVAAFKNKKATGGSFALTGLSNRLERLFIITGLSEIMEIKSNLKGEAE